MAITIKQIIALTVYGLVCFFGSLVFVQCSEKSAQNRIQDAVIRAEKAEANVCTLTDENERLRDSMMRANDAVERALNLILEAQDRHEERMDIIEHDPDAVDWLSCELPDSVRDVFKDYYDHQDRDIDTP